MVPLLEAERVRKVAQDSALAHQVVAGLRNFESQLELQQFALHSLVLLARPIGGREGAVHIGMAPALPALQGPRGGICTVLTVMDRHLNQPGIQAMACWSLVNFALSSTCKTLLVEKKGVDRVLRAMETHPNELQVQFRGLFALINLVVPDTPGQQPDNLEVRTEQRRRVYVARPRACVRTLPGREGSAMHAPPPPARPPLPPPPASRLAHPHPPTPLATHLHH